MRKFIISSVIISLGYIGLTPYTKAATPQIPTYTQSSKSALRGTISSNDFGSVTYDWHTDNLEYDIYCADATTNNCESFAKEKTNEQPKDEIHGKVWSENVGWFDLTPDGVNDLIINERGSCTLSGVGAPPTPAIARQITGQAWGENFGWIDFSSMGGNPAEWRTCLDEDTGLFYGKAWSENIGELTMAGVSLDIFATNADNIILQEISENQVQDLQEIVFQAQHDKQLRLKYLVNGGGSPIKTVRLEIEKYSDPALFDNYDNDPMTIGKTATIVNDGTEHQNINFTHNFQDTVLGAEEWGGRDYLIRATIIDKAGNTTTKDFNTKVVAGAYSSAISQCAFNTENDRIPIADGTDSYIFSLLNIQDKYGNPITYVNGNNNASSFYNYPNNIKTAQLNINFTNTIDTNQIFGDDDLGDATCYKFDDFLIDQCGFDDGTPLVDNFSFRHQDKTTSTYPTDAGYEGLEIRAYAPSSSGNIINIDTFELVVQKTATESQVGNIGSGTFLIDRTCNAGGGSHSANTLEFKRLLENKLRGYPNADTDEFKLIGTEGSATNYNMRIYNNSQKSVDIKDIDIAQYCGDAGETTIDCVFEDTHENNETPPIYYPSGTGSYALIGEGIDHYGHSTDNLGMTDIQNYTLNQAQIGNMYTSFEEIDSPYDRNQEITPTSVSGLFPSEETISIRTEIGYKLNDTTVDQPIIYHGDSINNIKILPHEISLTGRIRSDVIGPVDFFNIGSISKEQIFNAIHIDVAQITRGLTDEKYKTSENISTTSWSSTHNNAIPSYKGDVLYFKDTDVNIQGSGVVGNLLISGRKTIIVEGGEIFINAKHIIYADENSSLGVIVLKSEINKENRNMYINPNTIDIKGIWYIEGSIFSYKDSLTEYSCHYKFNNLDSSQKLSKIYDGCNRDETELKNQLYFYGTLITYNTLAGSRKDPAELPVGVTFPEYTVRTDIEKRQISQGYDLKYLRQYLEDDGTGVPTGISSNLTNQTASVVIEFDASILTTNKTPRGFESTTQVQTKQTAE